jgi:membrane protease YdiL (CAAX protease family)
MRRTGEAAGPAEPRPRRRSRPSGSGGPSAVSRRNGLVLAVTLVAAAVLTRAAYTTTASRVPGYAFAIAGVLAAGTFLSGGLPRPHRRGRHPLVGPLLTAAALFVVFALLAAVARLVPPLHHAVVTVLAHADRDGPLLLVTSTAAAGVAEELFYRGALFERLRLPVLTTTLAHVLTTLPALNVALTGAAALAGLVLGMSRRTSGGWWAPAVTHVGWALMMIWWLPR